MANENPIYAHTLAGQPPENWETLDAHAANVAALARTFADAFGAGEWGNLLGRWHDLGKRSGQFQAYLRDSNDPDAAEEGTTPKRVDHSTFGAKHAAKTVGNHFGQLLAYCIAGHHAGLADAFSDDDTTQASTLHARLKKEVPPVAISPDEQAAPKLTFPFNPLTADRAFCVAFFTRMLFSALVDADRIATEAFCDPHAAAARAAPKPSIADLSAALQGFLDCKQSEAAPTSVNRIRAHVLGECLAAAQETPGFFSLNVPTGGGKTLSGLAFALRHAAIHDLRRVVVAIPFTSIIEQTADVYRSALGAVAGRGIVEHHSAIDPKIQRRQNKLAVENWDAPLVVTTNVQLYESLFAAATTPCRKLHRLARSVIVLDEAQTIPVELLHPTLLALKELVVRYGCTIVLCTATQPALERREKEFDLGLENVRPIIREPAALFSSLRRVEVHHLGKLTDDALAARLAQERAALCVVNTRPHAAGLFSKVIAQGGAGGCYHLSTFMCAQHRRDKLLEIRARLRSGEACRLVSTQLIEAGVDVDFPAVYRAPAGFDSIAQAAGRCNREGCLQRDGRPALGQVYLFDTETLPPPGLLRSASDCARELRGRYTDPLAPEATEAYFRLFYWSQQHRWDHREVLPQLANDFRQRELQFKFKTAALHYKIIRDEQTAVLVPYNDEAKQLISRLMTGDPVDFVLLRQSQRYIVGLRERDIERMAAAKVICQHDCGLCWLTNQAAYSPDMGISFDGAGFEPDSLMV